MRTAPLKQFDAALSSVACALAARLPKRSTPSGTRTLIIRPGGLGDLICADMALQAIGLEARQFQWLIEMRSRPWAAYRGLTYLCYDQASLQALGKTFSKHDLVLNTEQLFGLSQAYGLLARARGGRLVSFATNRGARHADLAVPYDWKDAHEVLEFARLFSVALTGTDARPAKIERPRLRSPDAPPLVLIAGRQQRSRRLPVETWAGVVARWHGGREFGIAAAPEDAAFADELARRFGGQAQRFSGDFSALCARVAGAEEFLTLDGGGVHIASHFGVPTLAIFTSGRDGKWHPLGGGSRVLRRHDLPCQPCTLFGQVPPCPNHYACQALNDARLDAIGSPGRMAGR